jgi:YVTN family beta-propeller protein
MKVRIPGLFAMAALVCCLLASAPTFAQNAYIANEFSNTVSVIATGSNMVIDTIPVGGDPYGVAVSPDGSKVYVTNAGSDTVSVIATASNTVIDTISVGSGPIAFGIFIQQLTPTPVHPRTKADCMRGVGSALPIQPSKTRGSVSPMSITTTATSPPNLK